jgi:hypothetical protein
MNTIPSRETAYTALLTKLQTLSPSTFKTLTRRLKHWQDVPMEDQPALYMEHAGEVTQIVRGQPARVVLEVNLWIYCRSEGDPVGPVLNPLLDALDTALKPQNDGDHVLTLGGVVHHVWIEGQTQIFEGDLGEEAVAIVPVKMLVT